jgi:hypothetical protein
MEAMRVPALTPHLRRFALLHHECRRRSLIEVKSARRCVLLFECLEVGDDVADLIGIEPEFRHVVVASADSFGEGFLQ